MTELRNAPSLQRSIWVRTPPDRVVGCVPKKDKTRLKQAACQRLGDSDDANGAKRHLTQPHSEGCMPDTSINAWVRKTWRRTCVFATTAGTTPTSSWHHVEISTPLLPTCRARKRETEPSFVQGSEQLLPCNAVILPPREHNDTFTHNATRLLLGLPLRDTRLLVLTLSTSTLVNPNYKQDRKPKSASNGLIQTSHMKHAGTSGTHPAAYGGRLPNSCQLPQIRRLPHGGKLSHDARATTAQCRLHSRQRTLPPKGGLLVRQLPANRFTVTGREGERMRGELSRVGTGQSVFLANINTLSTT